MRSAPECLQDQLHQQLSNGGDLAEKLKVGVWLSGRRDLATTFRKFIRSYKTLRGKTIAILNDVILKTSGESSCNHAKVI